MRSFETTAERIAYEVRAANDLPTEVNFLGPGARRFLEWRAAHAGISPQEYLDEARAERHRDEYTDAIVRDIQKA